MEICTRTIPSTGIKTRGAETRSSYGSEVRGMCGIELSLSEESSRVRRIQVRFNIQNVETYMTLGTYILDGNESGMHEGRKQYLEGTMDGA